MFKGVNDQTVDDSINGVPVTLRFKWNARFQFWSVSIYDRQRALIVAGIKLVRDYPLLGYLELEQVEGEMFFIRLTGDDDYPRFENLVDQWALCWLTDEDYAAMIADMRAS